jgi:hypothetical protein
MSEYKLIGKENRFDAYPDTLISALDRDRNSMVDSFVDEAVRFYVIMLVYPTFPVEEAMQLARAPKRYKIEAREEVGTEGWLVTITEVIA